MILPRIKRKRDTRAHQAQTLVFFMVAFTTIFLLCGLAIDAGVLYLASARLSRAVDGAALAAVGNFNRISSVPQGSPITAAEANREAVATILRNFAVANYNDLSSIGTSYDTTAGTSDTTGGATGTKFIYMFDDGQKNSSGNYTRYVKALIQTGSGGQITSAQVIADCPARTFLMGVAGFYQVQVSATATATRNPRLIMVVLDRSASMTKITNDNNVTTYGGAYGLSNAVIDFLDYFDTSSDYIGIVSFGSNARLEMALTTNFLVAGATNLSYTTNQLASSDATTQTPGVDPEASTDPNYATAGIRRMKFGGNTAADEGMRMAIEELMQNPAFNDPDVYKYIVLFTDGAFNTVRTLYSAPGYTNVFVSQPDTNSTSTYALSNSAVVYFPLATTNSYLNDASQNITDSPYSQALLDSSYNPAHLANAFWQSADQDVENLENSSLTPGAPSAPMTGKTLTITNNGYLGAGLQNAHGGTPVYTQSFAVWLPPGAVDYVYPLDQNGNVVNAQTYISRISQPAYCFTNTTLAPYGGSNVLIVPGYVADGNTCDAFDIYDENAPSYNGNNFTDNYQWRDGPAVNNGVGGGTSYLTFGTADSFERQLMLRNYYNLMTGLYIYKPDDPLSTNTADADTLAVDANGNTPKRPVNGLGPYYPSAPILWSFDLVGMNQYPAYESTSTTSLGTDPNSRFFSWTTNMLASTPEWAGEVFYQGVNGVDNTDIYGNNVTVGTSTQMTSPADWQAGYSSTPASAAFPFPGTVGGANALVVETNHYASTVYTNAVVLRPYTYCGYPINNSVAASGLTPANSNLVTQFDSQNHSGGYVIDDVTDPNHPTINRNSMCFSGRPTHYYDFSLSSWEPITNQHDYPSDTPITYTFATTLGFWKAKEYAYHARALGVTIYTIGFGGKVTDAETQVLANMANSATQMKTDYSVTSRTPLSTQPVGQQFYASTPSDLDGAFKNIAQSIAAGLTQ